MNKCENTYQHNECEQDEDEITTHEETSNKSPMLFMEGYDCPICLEHFKKEKEEMVVEKLKTEGYRPLEIREKDGWIAISAEKQS